jgi:hypothetical protein
MFMNDSHPLQPVLWLWLPLLFLSAQIIIEIWVPHSVLQNIHNENGPHEAMQVVALVAAFLTALMALRYVRWRTQAWLGGWLALAFVCCVYVAGEEMSWGQHIFDWVTPEYWKTINDQHETNLHNLSSWLDQKPRFLLEAGVICGGIIMPLLLKFYPRALPQKLMVIYPPFCLIVVALIAIIPKYIDKAARVFDIILFERVSEVQELGMFYFVLLYLLVLFQRVKAVDTASKA